MSVDTSSPTGTAWTLALELAPDRSVRAGSKEALAGAIGRGADLRVYTEFLFEEHIAPGGNGDPSLDGLIREVIDFRETILVDGHHVGAITTQRQPLEPPFGFNGTEPKMSFFMYTGDGEQALANLVFRGIDGAPAPGTRTVEPPPPDMPKMSEQEYFDVGTTGPTRNFVYDMETYRFWVRDDWEEVLAHDAEGTSRRARSMPSRRRRSPGARSGSASATSRRVSAAPTSRSCRTRCSPRSDPGSCTRVHGCMPRLTHPLVRVAAAVPLRYASGNWDVAWVFLRTDGAARVRRLDPYTRTWEDHEARFGCRWFAR